MPLICRPFSVNSYAISKIWFRTHSVDLRTGDIASITSLCKSYIYQDMLEKPSELVLYRKVDHGGLGLHNIKCKALASLLTTFLQTAASTRFQQSLYHNSLYRYYCLGDDSLAKPDMPPYYTQSFFDVIKKVKENSPLNPVNMSVKQWYDYLLEEEVTMEVVDDEGRLQPKKCRVELLAPSNDWSKSFYLSRLRGLSTEIRSFTFKLIHQLLPFNQRLNQFLPNNREDCQLCSAHYPESPLHGLFRCEKNNDAAQFLLHLTRPYDSTITEENVLLFNLNCEPMYEVPTMLVLATGLNLIWQNRINKKGTTLYQIRAEIECLVSLLRRSRSKKLREAGNMVNNTLTNFPL